MSSSEDSDSDWIFDFVLQFLNSGRFDAAVMDFVDEKCAVFDNEEENKLIYSEIHSDFKDHIEVVISSNLEDLGISTELFYEACVEGRNSRAINTRVIDKIIAMDDFLTFKKIMVKRNTELELETIRAYRKIAPGDMNVFNDDDEEQFEAALRETSSMPRSPLPDPDELEERVNSQEEDMDMSMVTTEEEMQAILRNSLLDIEVMHKHEELEQLELEQAIAMSLALEEERLRHMQFGSDYDQGSAMDSSDAEIDAFNQSYTSAKEYDNEYEGDNKTSSASKPRGGGGVGDVRGTPDKAADKSGETRVKRDKKGGGGKIIASPSKPLLDVPEPKPLKLRSELRPLPGISAGPPLSAAALSRRVDDFEEKKRQTMDVLSRNQEELQSQRQKDEALRQQMGSDIDGEAAKRAKYMREQRDKLLAIKKAERDAKVREEEERRGKAGTDGLHGIPQEMLQAQVKMEEKTDDELTAERKRAVMRNALARRMKQELAESSEAQQAKAQEDQFSELDRQLRQVEQLRRDNQQREAVLADQIRRQHDTMARNVQRSAANMKY
eukprot:gene2039-3963_t